MNRELNSSVIPKGLVCYQQSGCFHSLTFSCYRRQPLLDNETAYSVFERELEAVHQRYGFVVAGYVLMPEHVHLLVGEPQRSSLSVALQVLKQQTSRKLKRRGEIQFWQRRYYDFNVHNEEKRVEKLRYMHRNPVVRGLVEKPEQWPWSSFRHYLTGEVGEVEIESQRAAFRRGDQLPEDLRYTEKTVGLHALPPFARKKRRMGHPLLNSIKMRAVRAKRNFTPRRASIEAKQRMEMGQWEWSDRQKLEL